MLHRKVKTEHVNIFYPLFQKWKNIHKPELLYTTGVPKIMENCRTKFITEAIQVL